MLWVVMWSSSSQWDLRKSFLESSRKILLFDMRETWEEKLGSLFSFFGMSLGEDVVLGAVAATLPP